MQQAHLSRRHGVDAEDHGRRGVSQPVIGGAAEERTGEARSSRCPANKGVRYPQEVLTPEQAMALIDAAGNATRRDGVLLMLLYRTGLRVGEAVALCWADLDMSKRTIRVLRPKGAGRGKPPRVLGIDDVLLPYLRSWQMCASAKPRDPVFPSRRGTPISTAYVRRALPRLAHKAGVRRRVHAHMLRHTLAYELAMDETPLLVIQQILGHSNVTETARYISHLAPVHVIQAMHRRGRMETT